jgi:hypothetical protein
VTNWVLSFVEDVIAVGAVVLAVLHPVVILFVVGVFLVIFAWVVPKVFRRLRRMARAARDFFRGRTVEE